MVKGSRWKLVQTSFSSLTIGKVKPINLNGVVVLYANTAENLGLSLNTNLIEIKFNETGWRAHHQMTPTILALETRYQCRKRPDAQIDLNLWFMMHNRQPN